MSVGISPGDMVLLLQALNNVFNTLKSDAVKGFGRYWTKYKHFCYVVRCLDEVSNKQNSSPILDDIRRDICNSLKSFFRNIGGFKIYLDENRNRQSFRGAIEKLKWSWGMGTVRSLCDELESLVGFATFFLLTDQRLHATVQVTGIPVPLPDPQPVIDHTFAFDDACRDVRSLSCRYISSWENLHEFLLRVWSSKPGRSSISNMEYLIYNATTEKEFLPSSPCVQPFQDVIKSGNRLKMSVIFPYEDWHTEKCPGCRKTRSERSRTLVKPTCKHCGLCVHFRDSHDSEPDPLTQLAIDDITRSGNIRGMIEPFMSEVKQAGLLNSNSTRQERKDFVSCSLLKVQAYTQTDTVSTGTHIRNFRRVALCKVQWPAQQGLSAVQIADNRLHEAMNHVQRYLERIEDPELIHKWVAKKINASFLFGLREIFAKELRECYAQRRRETPGFQNIIKIMTLYGQCVQESRLLFHPSIVTLRCLLWVYTRFVGMEAKVVLRLSSFIYQIFGQSRPSISPDTGKRIMSGVVGVPAVLAAQFILAPMQFFVDPFIIHLNLKQPKYVQAALCRVLKDSRSLCLELLEGKSLENYHLDLSPECFFYKSESPSHFFLNYWQENYRNILELTLKALITEDGSIFKTLNDMLHPGSSRTSKRPTKPVVKPLITAIVQKARQSYSV